MKIRILLFVLTSIACACNRDVLIDDPLLSQVEVNENLNKITVTSDKAFYKPGELVSFTGSVAASGVIVRYYHLGEVIEEYILDDCSNWTWNPPAIDFKGYYVQLVCRDGNNRAKTVGTYAIDVSSTWTKFPRYGFLSHFCNAPAGTRGKVISNLSRHHINALQYYEWAYDHHHPLAGTPEKPLDEWDKYLLGTTCQREVISGYIDLAHKYNISSMFYNLCNGVFEWYERDGVDSDWLTYTDKECTAIDYHPVSVPPFRSLIYLVDPGRAEWLDYISKQTSDVYKVYDFDGFHIDQLGDRGTVYDNKGEIVDLRAGYAKFISRMKKDEPDKTLLFNAVSQFGQEQIAASESAFHYNEIWELDFGDIKKVLDYNAALNPDKNTVVGAYMHNATSGEFNTPAVLMTDAVIFALGGAHIELGEHMISSIYWPNGNVKMPADLESRIVDYYDFSVGYENILRDDVRETNLSVASEEQPLVRWDSSKGNINYVAKKKDDMDIIHLLNFKDAKHMNWRDDGRNQSPPKIIRNFNIDVVTNKTVHRVWAASPDIEGGIPRALEYSQNGMKLEITVPSLEYWTMIVIE